MVYDLYILCKNQVSEKSETGVDFFLVDLTWNDPLYNWSGVGHFWQGLGDYKSGLGEPLFFLGGSLLAAIIGLGWGTFLVVKSGLGGTTLGGGPLLA